MTIRQRYPSLFPAGLLILSILLQPGSARAGSFQDLFRQTLNRNTTSSRSPTVLKAGVKLDLDKDLTTEERATPPSRQEFLSRFGEVSSYQDAGIPTEGNGLGVEPEGVSASAPVQGVSQEAWWKLWKNKTSGGPQPFDFQSQCGIAEWDDDGEVLNCWFDLHSSVLQHLVWQDVNEQTGQVFNRHYSQWSLSQKQQLAEAVYRAYQWLKNDLENFSGPSLSSPPTNLLSLNDFNYPCNRFSKEDAWKLYLATVAHSLALEISGLVPWSFTEYSPTDQEILLNSKYFFQAGAISCQTYDDEAQTIPKTYQFNGYSNFGRVIPQPPTVGFDFLVTNNLLGPNHLSTLTKLLNWSHQLFHYLHGYSTLNVANHWHYRGGVPAVRVLEGTQLTDAKGVPSNSYPGVHHWTAGCRGTSEFFRALLRNANIPVQVYQESCEGHYLPILWTLQKALDHGDNPYSRTWETTPQISASKILIPVSQLQQWDTNSLCPIASRRLAEIAVTYISDILAEFYCDDLKSGLGHAQGQVYGYLSNFYTMEQLNQMKFWSRLHDKVLQLGSCALPSYQKPSDGSDSISINAPNSNHP